MIKHELTNWGINGPKKSWWYKMQLFNPAHHAGPLLYFDLDVVIVKNIDWMWQLPLRQFWAIQDFKYLWRPTHHAVNSSIMWWDTRQFEHVWTGFSGQNLKHTMIKYHGDQDYITDVIPDTNRRFFDVDLVQSWRWQCLDGGFDFRSRKYKNPGSDTVLSEKTTVLVFHGQPKPAQVSDAVVIKHWQ
jgi:hypothetical protein